MIIEDWRFLDALYMTIITISTVGYREINQIGDPGRVFTILLVAVGVGFSLYVAAAVVQFMVEGRMRILLGRRRLDQKINRLKNHYIVCGYGRIGRVICRNLRRKPLDMVAIDKSPELIPVMDADDILHVSGDAADEASLIKAGIRQNFNLIIIAIKKPEGNMLFNPSFEAAIMPDDMVIAVGELENLQKLEKILNP